MPEPIEYYHWEVTYAGKSYDFYILPDGEAICLFSTDRSKVINQEDPDMRTMAFFDPKARRRLDDIESEFSVSLKVDQALLQMLKESWDRFDEDNPETAASTPESVALESKIDDSFIRYLVNEILPALED
jgi:hypothetical protein